MFENINERIIEYVNEYDNRILNIKVHINIQMKQLLNKYMKE